MYLSLLAVLALAIKLIPPRRSPDWREEARRWVRNNIHYTRVFMQTHLRDPIAAVLRELFHGVEHTIDPQQVRETRESLRRMLQDFVRDVVPKEPKKDFEEQLKRAAQGSMESVTGVYESQVRREGVAGGVSVLVLRRRGDAEGILRGMGIMEIFV